jgi:4-amino-4-deoxy-L-arabinose transferase-like glycosyltransferase
LRFQHLGEGGLGNPFYAAAVRSMMRSRHNFVFASFDPLGTFSVDKPPLALWIQTLSALLFGYKGFSLILPQAIAGVAAVALVWWVVSRLHGTFAAGVAAGVLAVLPASVLVSRNNTMDTLVMMLSLGTVALVLWGASSGRLLPMLLAGLAVGLAFNTKGFEAFVALPGVVAYFWLASGLPLRRRIRHLAALGAVAAVVGLSWVTAISLVPQSDRPLVLNSDGDSALNLTFGYNGFDRILGHDGFNPASNLTAASPSLVPPGVFYGGDRGPLRIFGEFPGPLVAVVMPAVLAGACLLVPDFFDRRKRPAAALWLLWLGGGLAAFSASRLGSPHYLEAFSPALAACFAVAADAALGGSLLRRLIGLAGVAGTAAYALDRLTELGGAGDENRFLAVTCVAFAAAAAVLVLAQRRRPLGQALAMAPFVCVLESYF